MKFCPKCGNQLPDDARFCNKCGAPQPNVNGGDAGSAYQPAQMSSGITPREQFNNLMRDDPKFKAIVGASKAIGLFSLINLLFIIPFFVCSFTNVGAFTGVNVSSEGMYEFQALGITQFPFGYSAISLREFILLADAGGYALTPGDGLRNPSPLIIFIFGFVWAALIVLVSLIGRPKGYLMKTYLTQNGQQTLVKSFKASGIHFGPIFCLVSLMSSVIVFVNSNGINYNNGKTYIFGEVKGDVGGLVICIVVSIIFLAIILAANIILRVLVMKKLNKQLAE